MNHRFVGKREYGIFPKPDDRCVKCDVRYASHHSTGIMVDEGQFEQLQNEYKELQKKLIEAGTKAVIANLDAKSWQDRSDMWQRTAARYEDIRGWLRLCEDTPEGHAEFYEQCARIIFPDQYPEEKEE